MAHGMGGMRRRPLRPPPAGAMMHGEMAPSAVACTAPFLRELNLSDAQHDKIFKIMHDRAPALRDKAKEASKANYELHALMFSDKYDEARVRTLSETSAQAMATWPRCAQRALTRSTRP
jgi:Spy/CpxP family protein refolding chaperone